MERFEFPIEDVLKRIAILYDKIYFYWLSNDLVSKDKHFYVKMLLENHCVDVSFIEKLFIVDRSFVEDLYNDYSNKVYNLSLPHLSNLEHQKVVNLLDQYDKKTIKSHRGLRVVNIDTAWSDIEMLQLTLSIETAMAAYLNIHVSEFNIMSTSLHYDYQNIRYKEIIPNRDSIFGKLVKAQFFDFSKLSWANIFELRKSGFANDFRKEYDAWLNKRFNDMDDLNLVDKINQYIFDAKFKFIEVHKANPPKQLISSVFSNIPLPIPNPLGIFDSVKSVNKEFKMKKDYGWLMFLAEIHSKSS